MKAKKEREEALNRDRETNVKHYGSHATKKENVVFPNQFKNLLE